MVVVSPPLLSLAGAQTRGTATCPAGTVPLGGGAFSTSSNVAVNLNSSFPSATGWVADVNNATAVGSAFDVRVVCGRRPKGYVVVASDPAPVPAHAQNAAFAFCPRGTRILGGGGLSNSGLLAVNLNTTFPETGEWRVDEVNASDLDTLVTSFAICGRLPGYALVEGAGVVVQAGTQTFLQAACPAPKVPVSGGVFSFSGGVTTTVNTTAPSGAAWQVFMNSVSTIGIEADPFVICAGR